MLILPLICPTFFGILLTFINFRFFIRSLLREGGGVEAHFPICQGKSRTSQIPKYKHRLSWEKVSVELRPLLQYVTTLSTPVQL